MCVFRTDLSHSRDLPEEGQNTVCFVTGFASFPVFLGVKSSLVVCFSFDSSQVAAQAGSTHANGWQMACQNRKNQGRNTLRFDELLGKSLRKKPHEHTNIKNRQGTGGLRGSEKIHPLKISFSAYYYHNLPNNQKPKVMILRQGKSFPDQSGTVERKGFVGSTLRIVTQQQCSNFISPYSNTIDGLT